MSQLPKAMQAYPPRQAADDLFEVLDERGSAAASHPYLPKYAPIHGQRPYMETSAGS